MSVNRTLGRLSAATDTREEREVTVNGKTYTISVPKGSTPDQIREAVSSRLGGQQQPPEPSFLGNLGTAAAQRGAALVKGAGALIDAPTEAIAGAMRYAGGGAANIGAGFYDALGMGGAADSVRRNARTFDTALARPATIRSLTERAVAPPTDTAGKVADFGAEMLGGAMVPTRMLPSFAQPKPQPFRAPGPRTAKEVPTIPQLKQQANGLYDLAESKGVTASREHTSALAERFRNIAEQEGLVSPTGRVSSAYPKAKEALDLAADYAKGTMKPSQMKTVRKVLSDAAGSPDNSERRMAVAMLREFDDWMAPLAPEFAQARAIARRYISAGKINDATEAANARAAQFSGSGLENALRTEFRGLDRQILKGQERGFIPEVEQAIRNVSRGTRASNTARNIGKLAPTGVVSGSASIGVPFGLGTAAGGPAVGGVLSALTTGAGMLGRKAATNMAQRNAQIAELIARNGGPLAEDASIGLDSLVSPYLQRGLLSVSPKVAKILESPSTARLAADSEDEKKKKKKR